MKDTSKQNAETLLKRLLDHFYISTSSGGLAWGYVDGVTLGDIEGHEFEEELLPYLGETREQELRELLRGCSGIYE